MNCDGNSQRNFGIPLTGGFQFGSIFSIGGDCTPGAIRRAPGDRRSGRKLRNVMVAPQTLRRAVLANSVPLHIENSICLENCACRHWAHRFYTGRVRNQISFSMRMIGLSSGSIEAHFLEKHRYALLHLNCKETVAYPQTIKTPVAQQKLPLTTIRAFS